MVDVKKIEFEFKKYMDLYKADPELGRLMQQMTFQELFNEKFMKENSKFTSMDDMLFKSDFGLTNPLEIEKEVLSPDFDLWYEAPYEDKSGTIPKPILII